MDEGFPSERYAWGLDYVAECVPGKSIPEKKKKFIKIMNRNKGPKSMGKCILNTYKKGLESLLAKAKTDEDLLLILAALGPKCVEE